MTPQWDLLDLLADAGRREPTFTLRMSTEMTDLIREGDRVVGVRYRTADVTELIPEFRDRVDALRSMDDVRHLDVRVDRLVRWHVDGLLCIGDAAHAMSPVGGVGINLAVQDAVAAATLLAEPLRKGTVNASTLAGVRARRVLPTVAVQTLQQFLHRALVAPL